MMATEIEHKFLIHGDFMPFVKEILSIKQGYLSSVPERTVRIRIKNARGILTIKGKGSLSGMSRYEWETEVPLQEAEALLKICEPGVIEKTRYLIPNGEHTIEVDVFHGENEGLVMAEIEVNSEDEVFLKPDWLGKEVTGDPRYYNAALVKHPFRSW